MIAGIFRGLADAVFLARPLLWIPVWGYCIFGYCSGLASMNGFSLTAAWSAPFVPAAWMLVFSMAVGAVYVVNQIIDRDVDANNAGFPLLAKGGISLGLAWGTAAALALASLLLPLWHRPAMSLFSLCALATGIVYSVKPFYCSGRFVLDFLANAAGYACVAFAAGWYLAGAAFGSAFFISCIPYFFLMCAGSISSTLPDIDGDAACGKKTTAVVLGPRAAHVAASLFIVAGCVAALAIHDRVALFCGAVAIPLYAAHLVLNTVKTMESTYKIGGLVMMMAAAVIFPLLAPASVLALFATIFYFRLRYHVWYPSLVPAGPKR